MGIFRKIKGFKWTGWVKAQNEAPGTVYHVPFQQKAEFIMPDRTTEILTMKPGATIDDVIQK